MSSTAKDGLLAGLSEIADVGRDTQRGGYSRHLWQAADLELREWFAGRATALGLDVETDRNGNLWAWWGPPGDDAVVTGSHLDSVPGGGPFDGPLGIETAFQAVERLRQRGVVPRRPVAVVAFAEEEGSRFGVACLGSQLMTGAISPDRVRALRDADGATFADAARRVGFDTAHLGRDPEALARIGVFLELHVEQGRGLIDLGAPVAIASRILAHGRWTLTFRGQGNHAGATLMSDRDDPMIAAARAVLEVREAALAIPGSRATVGRLLAVPGGSNVIASSVSLTLDARAASDEETRALVASIADRVGASEFAENSWSPEVHFDRVLASRLTDAIGDVPVLPSGAGHDAGVLSPVVPTAMIFVRNPTGVSHAPEEYAELDDCLAGVAALESVVGSMIA
ncbi:MAG: allantoate amidohydrolase [Candidatus Microbacterium phytovorans]|uniref:Allantoate amidohydrolase n=1 Tax=Candidatus Microbacterium phytovorans TaxID=3121374 RepID=A0AAJ5W342_9MICO|nr:allantoate amidohydrolase [Microbacterium sp.]WEK13470.1 MAG: allantoate amidohydrolase [Microbacterium sp.]